MYPINIGKDKAIRVFFLPILFSKKNATGPTHAAANGKMGPIHEAASSVICKSHSSWHSEGDTFGNTGDDQAMPVPQPKAPNVAEIKDFQTFYVQSRNCFTQCVKNCPKCLYLIYFLYFQKFEFSRQKR